MRKSGPRRLATPLVLAITLITLYSLWTGPADTLSQFTGHYNVPTAEVIRKRCATFPGAKDVLVVLKTGATEVAEKLPTTLKTTLSCLPNYVIYSDHEEEFEGYQIKDVLSEIDSAYQQGAEEFQLYSRLQRGGRASLGPEDLSGQAVLGNAGDSLGRRLDRWKVLPMFKHAYKQSPGMNWFVFIETDTYVFWPSILEILKRMDSRKAWYGGSPIENQGIEFADGGSGIVVSNSAMQQVVAEYDAHKAELEEMVGREPGGDFVLGKAFNESGVGFTHLSPFLRGSSIGDYRWDFVDFDVKDVPLWCWPVGSYHGMSSQLMQEMWDFEQTWISKWGKKKILRNKDVFSHFLLPRVRLAQDEWDNNSQIEHKNIETASACEKKCEKIDKCLQYRFDSSTETCTTANEPQLGVAGPGTKLHSGWMHDRIEAWKDKRPQCQGTPWTIGPDKKKKED